jgi:hypothetical protein
MNRRILWKQIVGTLIGAAMLAAVLGAWQAHAASQAAQPQGAPFVVEYYYKAKWGNADEFLRLFKKNHYPVLQKQMESGRILRVTCDRPRYHATEDGRWDFRVTIVFKDAAAAHAEVNTDAIIRQLYPDRATFDREEQRRFEILLAHWDVSVVPVPL